MLNHDSYCIHLRLTCSHRQTCVNTVASLVSANGISLRRVTNGADDRTSDARVWMRPGNGDGIDAESIRVGSDWNVIGLRELGRRNIIRCRVKEAGVRHRFKIAIRR